MIVPLAWAVAGYLVGAIPFGFLIARSRGVDIFRTGSGNIGATNVGRAIGRKWGLLVFALDFAKGAGPAGLGCLVGGADELGIAAGLAAIVGHMFPVYLRFRGGKGVATGAGVVTVLLPGPALIALVVWLAVAGSSRFVSLASVAAAFALVGSRLVTTKDSLGPGQWMVTGFCFAAALLVLIRHRANLARLARGTENRLSESSPVRPIARLLHVVAVAVWCGSSVWFSFVAAPAIFRHFEEIAAQTPDQREPWLPVRPDYNLEQARQLAGMAVGPLFTPFFQLQFLCGVVVVATAAGWYRTPGRVNQWRFFTAIAALVTVAIGWPISVHVSQLRVERYGEGPGAEVARAAFGPWHGVSLGLQFATVLLVIAATAFTAWLPVTVPRPAKFTEQ